MPEKFILESIAFNPDIDVLKKQLHIRPGSTYEKEFERVFLEACTLAQPRAAYRVAYVEPVDATHVALDGVSFNSRVLAVNLEKAHRVFACLATCGQELDRWAAASTDVLVQFWAGALQLEAVETAYNFLRQHLEDTYRPGKTSAMSPGSLADWPLTEQRPLFQLLDGLDARMGVRLTDSLMMAPAKSISGIRFPTEYDFESCQLCQRPDCPGRRAAYQPHLYEQRFRQPERMKAGGNPSGERRTGVK